MKLKEYILTEEDWKNIKQLSDEKYVGMELWQQSKYNIEREEKFEKGLFK